MRWIFLVGFVYLAAVVQTTCGAALAIGDAAPDWLALVAVAWLLCGRRDFDFLVAGGVGLVADSIGPGRPGFGAAALLVAGYAIVRLRRYVPRDNLFVEVALTWPVATGVALAALADAWFAGELPLHMANFLTRSAAVGLYTALAGLPIWMVLGWLREPLLRRATT